MSETTVWQDAEGDYYAFGPDGLAAAQTADGSYEMPDAAMEAARVPDDRRDALESALGVDEVSGFGIGEPIPGIDGVVKKSKPPYYKVAVSKIGSLSGMAPADFRMRPY